MRSSRPMGPAMTDADDLHSEEGHSYVFPITPEAGGCFAKDDPTGILWRAHTSEASRRGAEFYNYGWATTDDAILSKTSAGYLDSQIDPTTMKVVHHWSEF